MKQQSFLFRNKKQLFYYGLAALCALANLLSAVCHWVAGYLLFYEKGEVGYVPRESGSYDRVFGWLFSDWELTANRARFVHLWVLAACLVLLGIVALIRAWCLSDFVKGILGLYVIPLCVAYVFAATFDPMGITQATEALLWIPYRGVRWGVTLLFGFLIFLRGWLRKGTGAGETAIK